MALVPKITSPCPIRFGSMPTEGRDFCGQCRRRVHNLDAMTEAQRVAFFGACGTEKVCVAYTVRRPRAATALAVGALLAAGSAVAQEEGADYETTVTGPHCENYETLEWIGGTDAKDVAWVDESGLAAPARPDLPTIDAAEWLPAPASDGSTHD